MATAICYICNRMISFIEYSKIVEAMCEWAKTYAAGENTVPDTVWDHNLVLIKEFEAANPSFILATSPTRHVEDGATGFRKVKHDIPMMSIENSNGIEQTKEWANGMYNDGVKALEAEYKIDGLSLALKYKEGVLVDAVTRGQDNVGDSVFENALRVQGVIKKIPLADEAEIRGEVVWKYADFEPYNDKLITEGKKAFANPRNGASGTLKLHDPDEVERRKLSFIGYLIVKGSPNRYQTDDIKTLESMGFEVPEHHTATNLDDLVKYAESMRERRFEQAYPIDGVVLKVDDKDDQPRFGRATKSPNYFRAYKFPPEEKETELVDIVPSIGMSGANTPVCIVKPVQLAMTTVTRITGHNWDTVEYLGLYKGCHVVIRKGGEIIPDLVKCVETGRSKDSYDVERELCDKNKIPHVSPWVPTTEEEKARERYIRPATCPCCGKPLRCAVNSEGKELVSWVCTNENCRAQIGGKLANFVGRECMNIIGIGPSIIEDLLVAGKLTFFDDFYHLTTQDFVDACGKRESGAKKLVAAIEKSRGNYLHQLIEGFSISGLGHQAAPAVADCVDQVGGLAALASQDAEYVSGVAGKFRELADTKGVSKELVDKFLDFIWSNGERIRELVMLDVAQKVKPVVSMKLAGKVCIMTGTFDALARDVFKNMVTENGGTICGSITKKCNLVLMGDGAGPAKKAAIEKLTRAGQKIDVYTPETLQQFLDLLK